MAGRGLNDAEVAAEMNKMVEFIRQEANEKAREIQVKADEEHNIEKAKIVRQETIAIEANYQKKIKQAEVTWKIQQSNHINKCRLRTLQASQEQLEQLFVEAKAKMSTYASSDPKKYSQLLAHLLEQGLQSIGESTATIHCRKIDLEVVQSLLPDLQAKVEEKTGKKLELKVEATIGDLSAGGIVVSGREGRIMCNNSLDARLELATEKLLPAIRAILFGIPKTRRFFD